MSASAFDQRQINHRSQWEKKESVRLLYRDFHRQLLENCPDGSVLDIGGGTAHVKDFRPDIVSTDILFFPGIDVVADAHRLPFRDGSFTGVVMLDVLHHLERPIEFLQEASRVLKPGGRLAMIEPAMTTIARRFYHYFHAEPVDMNADPFAPITINPNRDPFDANQAIPSLLFGTPAARRRVEKVLPWLRVRNLKWLSLFAYPLSGGFQSWSLMPPALVRSTLAFEEKVPEAIRRQIAFRMMVVLERL
ncbi:class I SAM-dependent methyltransferase [Bradyrhizobium sp. 23]|uniref:class I SAM-dependent methyltransferase n=1 Tax=Bradyrhizobium sp. 23 TaxID=2782667 RepID=UPI001FFBA07E|nr:class I SAM-dependent methyltransferase [Bradyrhizobium sp. 23]MCK1313382.1 class I SAM-dependent methyltransferase [Bradyrhizobium sp. 23]